jgi:hypothetical protein
MEEPPGWTDVSFALIQTDIARTAVRADDAATLERKEAEIDACEQRIQSLYLRYCDGSKPIHWLARHVAHVLLMELRFKTYSHPSLWAAPYSDKRQWLFFAAIDILDTSRRVAMEPQAAQWTWLLEAYLQFWPLRFALQELCHGTRPRMMDASLGIVERALKRCGGASKSSKENYGICCELFKRAKEVIRTNRVRDDALMVESRQVSGPGCDVTALFSLGDCESVLLASHLDGAFVAGCQNQFGLPVTDSYELCDLDAVYS